MGSYDDQVKRKRARTGCLKCRSRRRKCDEEKPTCRRCRDSGFQCKYGTKLSFLEKNAITLPTPSSPSTPSVSAYRNLQFVELPTSSSRTLPKPNTTATTPTGEAQTSPSSTIPETGLDLGDGSQHCVLDDSSPVLLFNEPLIHNQLPLQDAHQGILLQNTGPSGTSPGTGAYQTARVLLSLGNNGQSNVTSIPPEDSSARPPSTHPSPDFWSDLEPFASCRHAPQAHIVRFLRHYVYSIAPWLDTGDPDQTFRTRVSQLCLFSQPVLDTLLELSSTSLLARSQATQANPLQLVEQISHYDRASSAEAVAIMLTYVRIFILTEPFSWILPQQLSTLASQHPGLDEGGNKLSVSVSWLLLRLNLSRGLIQGEGIELPDMLLHSVSTPSGRGWSRDLLDYDRQPLLLCGKALNYCFPGQDSNGESNKLNKVEAWKEIFNSLDLWYSNRPQDFKPVLELEGHDRLFPLLLFTSPAAVMANQMYHTAMLLLLQHRPRTIAATSGRTAGLSPLRHAQKICGIGLNNTDKNGWDFSLVSSLFAAAKRMTYVPQQDAILQKFDQIEAMTGWNLKSLAPHLKQIWNPVS